MDPSAVRTNMINTILVSNDRAGEFQGVYCILTSDV